MEKTRDDISGVFIPGDDYEEPAVLLRSGIVVDLGVYEQCFEMRAHRCTITGDDSGISIGCGPIGFENPMGPLTKANGRLVARLEVDSRNCAIPSVCSSYRSCDEATHGAESSRL